MKKKVLLLVGAVALLALPSIPSLAQSNPGLTRGQTPTAAQWNSYFTAKQDYLGFTPFSSAGGTFTGRVVTAPPGATTAGFNLTPGTTPSTPVNGDLWTTSSSLFARINGATYDLIGGTALSVTVGTTAIISGTDTRILRNSAGVLGEYTITGTGTVVAMQISPTFVTPALGVATGTSLAIGGCTIGASALCATGSASVAGAMTITSASAAALSVGANGATNPALLIDNSTASSATGIQVKSAAAAGAVAVSAISSGVNEGLTIDAKGSGAITLGSVSTGSITLSRATTIGAALTYGGVTLSNAVTGTGNMVLSAGPTFTGTITAAAANFSGAVSSAAHVITSASASALAVGLNGTTNPALTVDASTASSATGIMVKSAAATGNVAISVTSSGTNEGLTIDAKGSGNISLGTFSTGSITLVRATTISQALTYGGVTLANSVTGTGSMVLSTNAALTTPNLGTPSAVVLTNGTNLPLSGHVAQAAYTLVGNTTGSSASPTAFTIPSLAQKASPVAGDIILLVDSAASNSLKYATVSSIASAGSVSSIAGNTGAFTLSTGITNSGNDIRLSVPVTVANGGTGDTGTAWTSYTATLTPTSGSLTSTTQNCAYKELGKTVFWRCKVNITNVGTATNAGLDISLPAGHTLAGDFIPVVVESATLAIVYYGRGPSGATIVSTLNATGGGWLQTGRGISMSGVYERT